MMFREGTPAFDLFVERDTESVPHDGRYHVRLGTEVIGSYKSLKRARDLYRAKRQEMLDAGMQIPKPDVPTDKEILLRLRAESDIRAWRSEWFADMSRKPRRGGRGGRGGV